MVWARCGTQKSPVWNPEGDPAGAVSAGLLLVNRTIRAYRFLYA